MFHFPLVSNTGSDILLRVCVKALKGLGMLRVFFLVCFLTCISGFFILWYLFKCPFFFFLLIAALRFVACLVLRIRFV